MGKTLSNIKLDDKAFFTEFAKTTIDLNLTGINSYLNALSIEFSNKISGEGSIIEQNNKIESYNDIKKTTYYNIKTLHETMSGITSFDNSGAFNDSGYISNPNQIGKIRIDSIDEMDLFSISTPDCDTPGSSNNFYDLYKIFQVVDRGNNDIGNKVLANLATLYRNLYAEFTKESITPSDPNNQEKQIDVLTKSSINNLFSSLATDSGFLYQQIPNYLNINGSLPKKHNDEELFEIVDHMFGVHTDTTLFGDTFNEKRNIKFGGPVGLPGYIFQLGTLSSSPDDATKNKQNDYTNSFCLDLNLDSNNEVTVSSENAPEDVLNSNVTAFVVDFGKQNQQMFKSLQLDTAQYYDTEESIKAWVNLVNDTGTGLQTTNLFPILEKRSYTCNVVSLGNATIQPLSYFYLRNVPLFHGTYWITNVSHKITPNTMVTEFKGVRQPIATKSDTRKALLRLLKEKIKDIEDANKVANTIQTEGLPDTQGTIKVISSSDKPYKEFIQQVKDGASKWAKIDGKEILGSYILSITRDNKMTAANYGLISYLYNISSAYMDSVDPKEVLPGMVKIAISNMKYLAEQNKDVRVTDSDSLSLSYLIKGVGQGFLPTDEMGQYLDNLTELNYIAKNHAIPKTTKAWDIQASNLSAGHNEYTIRSTSAIVGFSSDSVDLSTVNMFLDPQEKNYGNDSYRATNGTLTAYDLFTKFDSTNHIIKTINQEVSVEKVPDASVTTLSAKKPKKFDDVNKEAPFENWFWWMVNDEYNGGDDTTNAEMQKLLEFAYIVSDGSYDDKKLDNFIYGTDLNNYSESARFSEIKPKLAGTKKNNGFYQPSIFIGIQNIMGVGGGVRNIKWEDSYNIDHSFTFNNKYYEYDFDASTDSGSLENYKNFINGDLKSFYETANKKYEDEEAELKKADVTPIKIKFLGAYGYGSGDTTDNVTFFKSSANIIFSDSDRKQVNLEEATGSDISSIVSTGGVSMGEKRTGFLSRIVQVTKAEQDKWRKDGALRKETDEGVQAYLNSYWEAVGTTLEKKGGNQVAWSAAFISYVVKNSGASEFPYSAMHATYIVKSRDNKNSGGSYPWYGYDATSPEAKVDVGDIVCYSNGDGINTEWKDFKSDTHCHCDVVVGIEGNIGNTIGGNVSQTVGSDVFQLNDDGTIDINAARSRGGNSPKIYRGVLKYQPAEDNTSTTSGNFDPNATGTFTANQKYPALFQIVLSHESHTYDDLNWYDSSGLHSYFADSKAKRYGGLTKPLSQYTIGEVMGFQSQSRDSGNGQLWATGRYQIIPSTLKGSLKEAGLTEGDLYSPENQDKLGMTLLKNSAINYINKTVTDTQENLNAAALGIAQTWSSVGVPYAINGASYDQSYYGSNGTDRAATKTADIQAALKYYRNGGEIASTTSSATNQSQSSKIVAIGDSLATGIIGGYSNIKGITSPQVLDQVGKHLNTDGGTNNGGKSLLSLLNATNTTFPDVKTLVLSIGANDLWNLSSGSSKEKECIDLIKKIFPKATYYIVNGNYGWGNLQVTTSKPDTYWQTAINNYINVYKNAGFTVIGNLSLCTVHPYKGDVLFTSMDSKLKSFA